VQSVRHSSIIPQRCSRGGSGRDGAGEEPVDRRGEPVAYVVIGHRVAADGGAHGVGRLGVAMPVAVPVVAPSGIAGSAGVIDTPALLAAAIGVGLCSSVIPYTRDQLAMARMPRATFALMLAVLPTVAAAIGWIGPGASPERRRSGRSAPRGGGCRGAPAGSRRRPDRIPSAATAEPRRHRHNGGAAPTIERDVPSRHNHRRPSRESPVRRQLLGNRARRRCRPRLLQRQARARVRGGQDDYVFTERLAGVKHLGLWPLREAASACFGSAEWPSDVPVPQACIEFEVDDVSAAAAELEQRGLRLLHGARTERGLRLSRGFSAPTGCSLASATRRGCANRPGLSVAANGASAGTPAPHDGRQQRTDAAGRDRLDSAPGAASGAGTRRSLSFVGPRIPA
jgi:hypothetical protein